MNDSELEACVCLNVAVPANEGRLRKYLNDYSAIEALKLIKNAKASERWFSMAVERARARLRLFDIAQSMKITHKLGIETILPSSLPGLADLDSQSPRILFVSGTVAAVDYSALVGTRSCTEEGVSIAKTVTAELGKSEGLVSGGANGIDLEAHFEAKAQSIPQLIVLAGGMDSVFPKRAADFINKGFLGAAISEMPAGVTSGKLGFLNRNRLIAAICKKLYLVEAPVVSGSINTAQHAINLKREVTVCLTKDPDFSPGGQWLSKKDGVKTKGFSTRN